MYFARRQHLHLRINYSYSEQKSTEPASQLVEEPGKFQTNAKLQWLYVNVKPETGVIQFTVRARASNVSFAKKFCGVAQRFILGGNLSVFSLNSGESLKPQLNHHQILGEAL